MSGVVVDVWEVRQEDRELASLRKEKEKKQGGGNEGREKVGGRGIGETMYLKEKEGIMLNVTQGQVQPGLSH